MISLLLSPVRVLYQLIQRLGVLDVTRLLHLPAGQCREQEVPGGYEIRSIGQPELRQLLEEEKVSLQAGTPISLSDGRHALVGAFHQGRVVSFAWFAKESVNACDNFSRSPHLGTSIQMPDGTAFVYNAWTDQTHRGQRLVAAVLTWAMRDRICGAWSLLTTTDWTNEKSIRAFQHLGMQNVGLICRCGRGSVQLSIVPEASQGIGLSVANDAPGVTLAW